MKKPEKLIGSGNSSDNPFGFGRVIGYNQACDDWEKWLPSEEEIVKLLERFIIGSCRKRIATALSKRIRSEK